MTKPHPAYNIVVRKDQEQTLAAGNDFLLRPLELAKPLGYNFVPARLDDLCRLGMAVHVADTICRRDRRHGGWAREIELDIEVSDLDFWRSRQVQVSLASCLDFLSGDQWTLGFIPASHRRPAEKPTFLDFRRPPTICLFSGGLDSLSGLVTRLGEAPQEEFLPVTVCHQTYLSQRTQHNLDTVRSHFARERDQLVHAAISAFLRPGQLEQRGMSRLESSHRCRAFLFAVLGGVVAALAESSRVEVYEPGIGAVNLPLTAGMTGSMASRSSHPYFLRSLSDLLTLVASRPIEYAQPFLNRTKGELARALVEHDLGHLAQETASCVSYPLRKKTGKQCGVCPGCIFRRQALFVAGIEEPKSQYSQDMFGDRESARLVPERDQEHLRAFLNQAASLRACDVGGVPDQLRAHLVNTHIVAASDRQEIRQYADLFGRYRREWLNFAARARERGLWWGGMLRRPRETV